MRDPIRQAERLMAIHRGLTTPAAIGAAAGMPAAVGLLTRRPWRAGGVAALRALVDLPADGGHRC